MRLQISSSHLCAALTAIVNGISSVLIPGRAYWEEEASSHPHLEVELFETDGVLILGPWELRTCPHATRASHSTVEQI